MAKERKYPLLMYIVYIVSVAFECILLWFDPDDLDHEAALRLLKFVGMALFCLGGIFAFAAFRIIKEIYKAPSPSGDHELGYPGKDRWRTVRYDQFKKLRSFVVPEIIVSAFKHYPEIIVIVFFILTYVCLCYEMIFLAIIVFNIPVVMKLMSELYVNNNNKRIKFNNISSQVSEIKRIVDKNYSKDISMEIQIDVGRDVSSYIKGVRIILNSPKYGKPELCRCAMLLFSHNKYVDKIVTVTYFVAVFDDQGSSVIENCYSRMMKYVKNIGCLKLECSYPCNRTIMTLKKDTNTGKYYTTTREDLEAFLNVIAYFFNGR